MSKLLPMIPSLERENSILLACARTELTEKNRSVLCELVSGDVNWENLLILAAHHKLLPLLYKNLISTCTDKVPELVMSQLREFHEINKITNLKKLFALVEIERLFKENGIPVISVKGPILTLLYLEDIALRSFYDLDILVRPQDFKKSVMLLKSIGYEYTPKDLPEKYFFKFARSHYHGQMIDSYGVIIELHWDLSGHYGARLLDYQYLEPYVVVSDFHGCKLSTLCPEMLVVYLAVHAQRHSWQRYDYLLCIAAVLEKSLRIDWDNVYKIANEMKVDKVVRLAVYMVNNLLKDTDRKETIPEEVKNYSFEKITRKHRFNWVLINKKVIQRNTAGLLEWRKVYPFSLNFISRFNDVIWRYYRKCFLPEISDWERLPVPFRMRAIYYITRPIYKLSRVFNIKNNS